MIVGDKSLKVAGKQETVDSIIVSYIFFEPFTSTFSDQDFTLGQTFESGGSLW